VAILEVQEVPKIPFPPTHIFGLQCER